MTPDKRIVWVFDSPNLKVYRGNEDVNFAADCKVMTADIRNCRILFVDRETLKIGTQWGKPGQCKHDPPNLRACPNGATPLANGDILVSEISGSWISRITREGKVDSLLGILL